MKQKATELWSKIKKIRIEYLVVIALAIVALILVFNAFSDKNSTKTGDNEIVSYVDDLERKLEACLGKINGVGDVKVIISVASGKEQVIATEKRNESGVVIEEPIMVGGKPFIIKESYPSIVGVVIVAEGANNLGVKMNVLSAAKVFLSIDESKIKVLSA